MGSSMLNVTPVSPTARLTNTGQVAEGSPATVAFSQQVDPSPVETAGGFRYSYDFDNDGTFEVTGSTSASAVVPGWYLLTLGPHVVHARITEAMGGKFTDYYTTIFVIPSLTTVRIQTPVPTSVPGEPVPLLIQMADTSVAAAGASYSFNIAFGDGDTKTLSSTGPAAVTHTYATTGTFVVQVTATDEFGNKSVGASQTIKVVPVALEIDPFNTSKTALFVGGTSGNDSVNFAPSGKAGIAVTLNGVSAGVFNANGSLIVFGQGGNDVVTESPTLHNPAYLIENLNDDNVDDLLAKEAIHWAGLNAAMEILAA
jgi:PKD repeat protein